MARIQIGDVFELNTEKGRAYLHYIYRDKQLGELIRILNGLYSDLPNDLDSVVRHPERYVIFFPLSAAYKKDIVIKVGHVPVDDFPKPKYMRSRHDVRGQHLGWHIVDTDTWQRVLATSLSEGQKQLSPWGIWNDTLLKQRIVEDWSLEKWV